MPSAKRPWCWKIIQGKTTVAEASRTLYPGPVATAPNERWSTGLCQVWAGRDGWVTLALVIDCHTRELLGWHLSCTGKTTTAVSGPEHALITRFSTLGRVLASFLLRSDNGLVFTSCHYTSLVRSYELRQEFIAPYCSQQNGIVERVIRTLKEQCVHRQCFESLQHASRAIGDWIHFYNHQHPHFAGSLHVTHPFLVRCRCREILLVFRAIVATNYLLYISFDIFFLFLC